MKRNKVNALRERAQPRAEGHRVRGPLRRPPRAFHHPAQAELGGKTPKGPDGVPCGLTIEFFYSCVKGVRAV